MAITKAEPDAPPAARCLDLSRLVSRIGRGPDTGIDRVERAYFEELLRRDTPFFALVRISGGHVLLDRAGAQGLLDRMQGSKPWGAADMRARLSRLPTARARAEADLRRLAIARAGRAGLSAMLRRALPEGTAYLNVGHSNLRAEVLSAFRALPGSRITVFMHDAIPLDFPHFQRPGSVPRFRERMSQAWRMADLILCPSRAAASDLERHFGARQRAPVVAPLGVKIAPADTRALPPGLDAERPFFLCVGTIEPRKNHALLLDLWEGWGPGARPGALLIAGRRGWANERVFARLDAGIAGVSEFNGLSDGAIAALMERASAVLMPSLAEGFGLPAAEAAARGAPLICSDLPVFREVLGNYPIYLSPQDGYSWSAKIRELANRTANGADAYPERKAGATLPDWAAHFNLVLRLT